MQNHRLGIHSDKIWADSNTKITTKYHKTYSANLPNQHKYLGYLNLPLGVRSLKVYVWFNVTMQIWIYHAKIFYFVVILYNFEIHHCCKMQKCKKERKKDKYEFMRTRIFILFLFVGGDGKKGYLLITLENGTFFVLFSVFFLFFFSWGSL